MEVSQLNEIVQVRLSNWASIIKARQDSGQTIRTWCADNDISVGAYYYWLRKLRQTALDLRSDSVQDTPCFARIPDQTVHASSDPSAITLRIRRGGTVIEVGNDVSDSILSLLKDAIRPC